MNEEAYFQTINYVMLFNTLPVIGYVVLCCIWAFIARTPAKKVLLGGMAGFLIFTIILRVLVIMLPANLTLLLLIGILHGIMLFIMFGVFLIVTMIVLKRTREMDLAEKCRAEACSVPAQEQWDSLGEKMYEFGRKAKWL